MYPFQKLSDQSRQVALKRLPNVVRYLELLSEGCSSTDAALRIGLPHSTIRRYAIAFKSGGLDGLMPRRHRCGRRSKVISEFDLTPHIFRKVESLAGELGSAKAAWQAFTKDLACDWRLRKFIRTAKRLPTALTRPVHPTPIEVRAFQTPSGAVHVHLADKTVVISDLPDEKPNVKITRRNSRAGAK